MAWANAQMLTNSAKGLPDEAINFFQPGILIGTVGTIAHHIVIAEGTIDLTLSRNQPALRRIYDAPTTGRRTSLELISSVC